MRAEHHRPRRPSSLASSQMVLPPQPQSRQFLRRPFRLPSPRHAPIPARLRGEIFPTNHLPPRHRRLHPRQIRHPRPARQHPPRRPRHHRRHLILPLLRTLPPPSHCRKTPPRNPRPHRPRQTPNVRRHQKLPLPHANHQRNPPSLPSCPLQHAHVPKRHHPPARRRTRWLPSAGNPQRYPHRLCHALHATFPRPLPTHLCCSKFPRYQRVCARAVGSLDAQTVDLYPV